MKIQVVLVMLGFVTCVATYSWAQDKDSSAKASGVVSLDQARALYELGDYKAAVQAYDGVLRQIPESALALAGKVSCLNQIHRYDEALLVSGKAIQIDKTCILAYAARGDALGFLGRQEEAIKAYATGEAIAPQDATAFIYRGALRLAMKSPQSAIDDLKKAIDLDPKRSLAYYNTGTSV